MLQKVTSYYTYGGLGSCDLMRINRELKISQEDKKMKKIKRLLGLCLVCAMLIGVVAIPVGAVFSAGNAADYVEQLYTGLLGRPSDEGGRWNYVNQLYNQGVSAGTVAQEILGSAEFRSRQLDNAAYIDALYLGLLGRTADEAGKASFLSYMDCGQSRAWVYQQILASAEFKNRCENYFNMYVGTYATGSSSANPNPTSVNVSNATQFVIDLYTGLLGRTPDASDSGVQHWVNMLSLRKLNAAGVAAAIASSSEFNSKSYTNGEFITRCYRALLGRDPDVGGYTNYVNELNNGKTRAWVFSAICSSNEFQRRAEFAPGGANVEPGIVSEAQSSSINGGAVNSQKAAEYVQRLYLNLLNRSGGEEEIQRWVKLLVYRQLSAAGVAAAIASSAEAKSIGLTREQYVERLYGALLGRGSDPAGFGSFVGALQAGYSRSWVFCKICASAEFQNESMFKVMNVVPGTLNYTSYDMG